MGEEKENRLSASMVDSSTAAAFLGLSEVTLRRWRWLQTGPPCYTVGKYVRYDTDELVAWAKSRPRVK